MSRRLLLVSPALSLPLAIGEWHFRRTLTGNGLIAAGSASKWRCDRQLTSPEVG